ncbi:MAG: MauE/DoxX family redox-associated membrane protein [Bacteroidota bacterium]
MVELVKSFKSLELLISASYYFLIALLLFSGISKILDPQPLLETIKAVINVSEELQISAATLLPVVELTLGVMLLLRIRVEETLQVATILFIFFFLFSVYGGLMGLKNDCGCACPPIVGGLEKLLRAVFVIGGDFKEFNIFIIHLTI